MTTLYTDKFSTITEEGITVKSYYFPFALSKFIPFKDIHTIEPPPPSTSIFTKSKKSWGMGLDFNTWWACDMGREISRTRDDLLTVSVWGGGVAKRREMQYLRVGFTCENSVRVRDIVNSRIKGLDLKDVYTTVGAGSVAVEAVRVEVKEKK